MLYIHNPIRVAKSLGFACVFSILVMPSIGFCKLSGSLSEEAIAKRLQPSGQVSVEGVDPAAAAAAAKQASVGGPEQIYEQNCQMCHKTGLAGAPKLGSASDWEPRIAQGKETLYKHAISGLRAMPPKGNCVSCSEDNIKKTVDWMVSQAK